MGIGKSRRPRKKRTQRPAPTEPHVIENRVFAYLAVISGTDVQIFFTSPVVVADEFLLNVWDFPGGAIVGTLLFELTGVPALDLTVPIESGTAGSKQQIEMPFGLSGLRGVNGIKLAAGWLPLQNL